MPSLLRTAPIAWRMLTDRPSRMILSALAVTFSVVIMFMELGFFNGCNDGEAHLPPLLACDLVMLSPIKISMKTSGSFNRLRLQQARGVPGVATVVPLYLSANYWWNPQAHTRNRVRVLGIDPYDPMLRVPAVAAHLGELRVPGALLFDHLSRSDLGRITPGTRSTLGQMGVHVVGLFDLGPNFAYEGNVIVSRDTFFAALGGDPSAVDLGLIRLQPGQDVNTVRQRLYTAIGKGNILLLTPAELHSREIWFTTARSPAGVVFGIGLLVGFAIGVIVCYQILFNEITDHLPQFATLKAMGHPPGFISGIVLNEALLLSLIGYLPGLVISYFLYAGIQHYTQILMFLNPGRGLLILALAAGMCVWAGRLALRKVHAADPAELY